MLIVCDTNIIVSALLWKGRTAPIHRALLEGTCVLALDEYRRVLSYEKFGLSTEDVRYLIEEEIHPYGIQFPCSSVTEQSWNPEDPDDDRFVRLALEAEADCIVSGDSHLLNTALPCRVITASEVLEELKQDR